MKMKGQEANPIRSTGGMSGEWRIREGNEKRSAFRKRYKYCFQKREVGAQHFSAFCLLPSAFWHPPPSIFL